MATTKHAIIRYHTLDRCFSNPGRRFSIDDLLEACNIALIDYSGSVEGIKKRQLYDDIKFMESEQGWSIELEKSKVGRRTYYRYVNTDFSIQNQAINENEANQLKETLSVLRRFKGMPQFEWVEEMLIRVESSFLLEDDDRTIVFFEQNPYLKGLDHFSDLFNAIQYKKVIKVEYQSFKQEVSSELVIHPYILKEYNNRWFLFGFNEQYQSISNLALDRILAVHQADWPFKKNVNIDFIEFFEDVVGVTVSQDAGIEEIILEVHKDLWPYIKSKPIHGSQKVIERKEEIIVLKLDIQINYEFISSIFAYGERIKVVAPEHLKITIKTKAENVLSNYL